MYIHTYIQKKTAPILKTKTPKAGNKETKLFEIGQPWLRYYEYTSIRYVLNSTHIIRTIIDSVSYLRTCFNRSHSICCDISIRIRLSHTYSYVFKQSTYTSVCALSLTVCVFVLLLIFSTFCSSLLCFA